MKQLFLMRHAASTHGSPDINRPLNYEGRKEIESLASRGIGLFDHVTHVLCSSSNRTRQTFLGLMNILPINATCNFIDNLYHASAERVLDEILLLPDSAQDVLIIAHNPGVSEFLGMSAIPLSMSLRTAQVCVFEVSQPTWSKVVFKDFTLKMVV